MEMMGCGSFLCRGGFEEILKEEDRVEMVITRWDDRHLAFSIDSALTDIQELYEKSVTAGSHTNETVIENRVRSQAEPLGAHQHVRWDCERATANERGFNVERLQQANHQNLFWACSSLCSICRGTRDACWKCNLYSTISAVSAQ